MAAQSTVDTWGMSATGFGIAGTLTVLGKLPSFCLTVRL